MRAEIYMVKSFIEPLLYILEVIKPSTKALSKRRGNEYREILNSRGLTGWMKGNEGVKHRAELKAEIMNVRWGEGPKRKREKAGAVNSVVIMKRLSAVVKERLRMMDSTREYRGLQRGNAGCSNPAKKQAQQSEKIM